MKLSDTLYEEICGADFSFGIWDCKKSMLQPKKWDGDEKSLDGYTNKQILRAAHKLIKDGLIEIEGEIGGILTLRPLTPVEIVRKKMQKGI